jgi:type II secretory pathway pseudopilin PulG
MMMTRIINKNSRFGNSQSGVTLVALLAMMTIITISLLAVAPNLLQDVQREKELESIRRGEEVADAIREYVKAKNGLLPKSMDELLEGIPFGTKKRQILRVSAAIDPLSEDGKWRLIRYTSKELLNFERKVILYNGKVLPETQDQQFFQRYLVQLVNIVDTGEDTITTSFNEDSANNTEDGEFIGVASQSKNKSVIVYYGLEKHNKWIFTPLFRGGNGNGGGGTNSGGFGGGTGGGTGGGIGGGTGRGGGGVIIR